MAKTRRQTRNAAIKKEQEDCTSTLGSGSVTRTTRNTIAKRTTPKNKKSRLPAQDIKVEEDTNTKSMLQSSSKNPNLPKGQQVSQEQIDQLFDYILNENMSVTKASRMVKLSQSTGSSYYNIYKNDPEKKIPTARRRCIYTNRVFTQEHVEDLIRYIVDDKMSLAKASEKANIGYRSANFYYKKYLDDPDHKIPIPFSGQSCTQEQREAFIGYIVNDKMSIRAASKKANMDSNTAKKTCNRYFNSKDPIIPAPSHIAPMIRYTQKQIKDLISYIVNDKMTICAASKKINMCSATAKRHYCQYLKDNSMDLPTPKINRTYTQEEKNQLISLIVDEKMAVMAAAKKLTMSYPVAMKCYRQYLKNHNLKAPPKYTQDQINKFIGYIVDDKMTKTEAAKKAKIGSPTANKHYYQYLTDHNLDLPFTKYPQDQKDKFIRYIIDDKMSLKAASEKANVNRSSGRKIYRRYLKDHNLPLHVPKTFTQDQIDEFISYIVDDKMTMQAATKKANMSDNTGTKYYYQYLKNHNLQILHGSYTTQEKIDEFIGYMIDDKMNLAAASKKAKISTSTGRKYYRRYLEDHNLEMPIQKRFTQKEINELISNIVHNKMSVRDAAKKANMCKITAIKYYRQYQKENNLPVPVQKIIKQDQIDQLIGYIVHDKMTINAASKKANMTCTTGSKYYQQYLNNQ